MKVKVKNDREFDVQVKFQEDGEEKVETIAAGAEIEVPEDQAEAVKQQIADAEAPEAEEAEEKKEEKENEFSDREKALADREAAIAEKEAALAKKAAEAKFDKLLSDGKVVPAQKEAFMALSEVASQEIHLSDDETKTVDTLLSEFIESSPALNLTDEKGAESDDNGGGEEVELGDDDKKTIERYGLNEEDYKEVKKENQ